MPHRSVPRLALLVLCGALGACGSTTTETRSTASAAVLAPGAAAPLAVVGTAWDNFDHRGSRWACRDLSSGEMVSSSMCYGLTKDDRHWPGMAVPPGYRGMPDP
ncbi:hypothetical protein [Massilia sp. CFBP9026]|uniref:hypothetical protein n=1 Tax=Massilia sp. CFBP9026 TaxID=3096536 RepID=UPI002A6A4035|nr:hypothetical protein [Massilia sp. CFBP9026]MDY0964885.1 hypothetical protein [Massilia sp. CFBP9026]